MQHESQAQDTAAACGRMRALRALGEWPELAALAQEQWTSGDAVLRAEIAPLGAAAAYVRPYIRCACLIGSIASVWATTSR